MFVKWIIKFVQRCVHTDKGRRCYQKLMIFLVSLRECVYMLIHIHKIYIYESWMVIYKRSEAIYRFYWRVANGSLMSFCFATFCAAPGDPNSYMDFRSYSYSNMSYPFRYCFK